MVRNLLSSTRAADRIPRPMRRGAASILIGIFVIACSAGSSGCYRRVVGVSNDSGYEGKVYEPNLRDGEENVVEELFTTERSRGATP